MKELSKLGLVCVLSVWAIACSSGDRGTVSNNCVGGCGEDRGPELFGPADEQDWVSFRNGPRRTGIAVDATLGTEIREVWRRDDFLVLDYSAAKPSGVVWGDTLFYPSDGGTMWAFDRHTGEPIWSRHLTDASNGIHGSPAVTRSTVVIGTYSGWLHTLDRHTGEEIWRYRIGNVIGSSPVYVGAHNALYTSHETPQEGEPPGGGYVTRNDPRTGEETWRSEKLRHWPHASVAVDPERGVVVVGANDGVFHAYSTDDGTELWSRDFEPGEEYDPATADIKTTAAISAQRGLAVFGTWDRHIYALDIESGEQAWKVDTGGPVMGSAALHDGSGRVYIGTRAEEALLAIDLDSGEVAWRLDVGAGIVSSPAVNSAGDGLIVGTNGGELVGVDANAGEVVWRFDAGGEVTASPAWVGRHIFVAAKNGALFGLETASE
ncbi:MAG: PQQ-binding-like beta-propeller repeat protein [Myxococcota bacterium]